MAIKLKQLPDEVMVIPLLRHARPCRDRSSRQLMGTAELVKAHQRSSRVSRDDPGHAVEDEHSQREGAERIGANRTIAPPAIKRNTCSE